MPHSPDLINSIAELLAKDYPNDTHEYVIEKLIPGTRMSPDIAIRRNGGGHIVCAVEIGYTRPEKLTRYRDELNIPDVRWYDKGGNLHTPLERKNEVVTTTIVPTQTFYVYDLMDQVSCPDCAHEWQDDEGLEEISDSERERLLEESVVYVMSTLVTDYTKWSMPSFCDKCGLTWFADTLDVSSVADLGETWCCINTHEFARTHGARREMSWDESAMHVQKSYGIDLVYADFYGDRTSDHFSLIRRAG